MRSNSACSQSDSTDTSSRFLRISEALQQASAREPGDNFGRGRAVKGDPFAQRFLVDVLLRPQRVEDGELGRGHLGRDLGVPEPVVDLLGAPDQVTGMAAQVIMRG